MKNGHYIITIPLLLLSLGASAQAYSRLFDADNKWQGFDAAAELDSGKVMLSGVNVGTWWDQFFIWNITLDAQGDTLYTRRITSGDSSTYYIGRNALIRTGSGFYMAGTSEYDEANLLNGYLMKLDPSGSRIWEQHYGGPEEEIFDAMISTRDGGLLMAGSSHSFGDPVRGNAYVVRSDTNGMVLWEKTYGQNNFPERCFAADTTTDGGFLLAGVQGFDGQQDIFLLKVNENGEQIWKRSYGFPQSDDNTLPRIRTLKNGNCLLTTALRPGNNGIRQAYMAAIDPAGNTLWEKFYPAPEWHSDFGFSTELPGGDLVIGGAVMEYDSLFNTGFQVRGALTKTNAQGNLIWQRKYFTRPDQDNYQFGMLPLSDAGFLMYGFAYRNNNNRQDAWVVRVDSAGCLEPGCQTLPADALPDAAFINVFPNPARDFTTIASPEAAILQMVLCDVQGRVLEDVQFLRSAGIYTYTLHLSGLMAGHYLIYLRTAQGWASKAVSVY